MPDSNLLPTTDLPTIRSVSARPLLVALDEPLTTASGRIEAEPLVLIDLTTEEGVTGRTWLFAYSPMVLGPLAKTVENLTSIVAGQRLAPVAQFDQMTAAMTLLGAEGLVGMAISGLDMAIWDALARSQGKPLWALLGGTADPIPVYYSVGMATGGLAEELVGTARGLGCRAFKVKLGHERLADDIDVLKTLRAAAGVGPEDFAIMVDYNQSLLAPEAIRRSRALAEIDEVAWLEEPLIHHDHVGHAAVRAASPIPVQLGENWWGVPDMQKSLAAGASDFIMPDIMKMGGVTGWLRMAGLADGAGIPTSSHLFIEASAHTLPVVRTQHYLEWLDLAGPLLQERYTIVDGGVVPPDRPGMGMDWDEAVVKRYVVDV